MSRKLNSIICMFVIAACHQNSNTVINNITVKNSVEISDSIYQNHKGIDCDLPDTLRTDCADINFVFPQIKTGNAALQKAVQKWTNSFLSAVLLYTDDTKKIAVSNLTAATQAFYNSHETFKGSNIYGAFTAKSYYKVLYNDSAFTTLEINGYSYQGGAHSSSTVAVASFNNNTGRQLILDDIIIDKKAFATLVEKQLKLKRTDVFKDGFRFDDVFKFALPKNYGLTQEGIYMHYEEYEIFPYAYGSTIITIPYTELETLLKQKTL